MERDALFLRQVRAALEGRQVKKKSKVGIVQVVLPEVEALWLKANATNVSKFCSTLVLREIRKMMREQMGNEAVEIA